MQEKTSGCKTPSYQKEWKRRITNTVVRRKEQIVRQSCLELLQQICVCSLVAVPQENVANGYLALEGCTDSEQSWSAECGFCLKNHIHSSHLWMVSATVLTSRIFAALLYLLLIAQLM